MTKKEDRVEEIDATTGLLPVAVKLDKPIEYFKIAGAIIGNLSGVIALATIIWGGGALVENVKALNNRVATLEKNGSANLQAHEALDNYRDAVLKDQIAEYRLDVRDMKSIVQSLRDEFAKQHTNTKGTP